MGLHTQSQLCNKVKAVGISNKESCIADAAPNATARFMTASQPFSPVFFSPHE